MPQVVLYGSGVMPGIGQLEPTGMAEHVRMYWKTDPAFCPALATSSRTVEAVSGPLRSVTKTYGVIRIVPL